MSAYRWKSFSEDEDRPEKPRKYGVTEMRGPHYSLFSQGLLEVSLFPSVYLFYHFFLSLFLRIFFVFLIFDDFLYAEIFYFIFLKIH